MDLKVYKDYVKVPRVYIAGKLNASSADYYIKNLAIMIKVGDMVRRAGFAVFVPGIDILIGLNQDWVYNDYFDNSQPWLLVSDAMFLVPGWESSSGVAREIDIAKEAGVPVFEDIEKLKDHFDVIK